MRKLPSAHTSFFTNEPSEELADYLVARAPDGFERFLTVSDGSVAVETKVRSLRAAGQYLCEYEKTLMDRLVPITKLIERRVAGARARRVVGPRRSG